MCEGREAARSWFLAMGVPDGWKREVLDVLLIPCLMRCYIESSGYFVCLIGCAEMTG